MQLLESPTLAVQDPALYAAIEHEERRQRDNLELIASENYASRAVREATASVMTNKYAEGYPGRRYYGGCEFVDVAETLALERVKALFRAQHANVQPHAGAQANMAVMMAVLEPGDTPVAFEHGGWRAGLSVCYDLRFPELYRGLMRPPCDVLFVPAAFTYTTGLAHWLLLLRARAVENQCYVVAPAQGGTHENGRRTFGHSVVTDPWGEVLSLALDGAEGEGVALAELSHERINEVRLQLPALRHRKL